jgi:hypothetical protein
VNVSAIKIKTIINIYVKTVKKKKKKSVIVNVIANIFVNTQFYYIILFVFALILKALELSKELVNKIYKWH